MFFNLTNPIWIRLLSLVGLTTTLLCIFLGAIWPSLYTIAALLILPAPFIFIAAIIKTKFFSQSRNVRVYLFFSLGISALCLMDEVSWLVFGANNWTPPWK
jgi:hypothetical protein